MALPGWIEYLIDLLYLVLHPEKEMGHFKKYWEEDLRKDVLELVERKVWSVS